MRVVIAGGGTGGHLFPGIAVAEELLARGHEIIFIGTERGIEARICPQEGYRLELIAVDPLKGKGLFGALKGLGRVPSALLSARTRLKHLQVDVVIGVGGYASGPVVLAAAMMGLPTAILEQNSIPGITNRMLGRVVRRVFGSFDEAARFFPKKKYVVTGNPVRRRVRESLDAARADGQRVLIVGGSQGAHAVNERVAQALILLAARGRKIAALHQTGLKDEAPMREIYEEAGLPVEVSAFIQDMASAYKSAAIAVCRAGASTLAELALVGLPSILIPLPTAADDHQTGNARALESLGAAVLLPQKDADAETLATTLAALLDAPAKRQAMSLAARAFARPKAHQEIADGVESLR